MSPEAEAARAAAQAPVRTPLAPGLDAFEHVDRLEARLRPHGLNGGAGDPLRLAIEAAALLLSRANEAEASPAVRRALGIAAPDVLPAGATNFERGLTMGLALALLTEDRHAPAD